MYTGCVSGAEEKGEADVTDSEREQLIEAYRIIGTLEPSLTVKRQAFEQMTNLIRARSANQIHRMEAQLGIVPRTSVIAA